jgi:prophage regulatory protein
MRILTKPELKKKIGYSSQHTARLEKEGKFPQRIQLGPCRVGWLESEVDDWILEKANNRPLLTKEE